MRNLINVGIVGLGQAGLRHLEAFTNLKNVEIVGVADPDKKILNDIGVKDMILLSSPIIYHGINAFGLNVIKYMSK